jgi:DNA-binding TFAR19-related protein (PDSD5 family)
LEEEDPEARNMLAQRIEQYKQAQEAERKLKALLLQVLESDAYERMTNVRIANPELYANTANAVVYYYQRVKRKITDKELVTLLSAQTTKREGSIHIERK